MPDVTNALRKHAPRDLAVSSVTLAELWFGALKSRSADRMRAVADHFLAPFSVLDFDRVAADEYADIRFGLERGGRPIGERDLLIAAVARSRQLTLVTSNVGEFGRVPGLAIEDWHPARSGA